MAKPWLYSWRIYNLKGTPAKFIGIVFEQPDAESAIRKAIADYAVPPDQRGKLIAQRRD